MYGFIQVLSKIFLVLALILFAGAFLVTMELIISPKENDMDALFGFLFMGACFAIPYYFMKRSLENKLKEPKSLKNYKKFTKCPNCNSSNMIYEDGKYICGYCKSVLYFES
ncbi:MAG: hypothetical protein KN64_06635 [Sulfurovum sp. AS07-7]|nr:MAG: hypothetical protein KN64_06635 [Sulfurovum sp. AS07-7]TQV63540.1 MAG: TFIIB-type zinc ribbon-containing protein [Sulfurovum sp.]